VLEIPAGLYSEDEFDIMFTGEKRDLETQTETMYTLFQVMASNPQMLQSPDMMEMLYKIAENADVPATFLPRVKQLQQESKGARNLPNELEGNNQSELDKQL